jgi:hypothetical protein
VNFCLLFTLRFRLIIVLSLFFAVVNLTLVDLPGLTKVAVGNTILLLKSEKEGFYFCSCVIIHLWQLVDLLIHRRTA